MIKYKLITKSLGFETKEIQIIDNKLPYETSDEDITQLWFEKLVGALNKGEKFLLVGKTIVPIKDDITFEITIVSKERSE